MARKVFISFLGTGNYIECIYKNGDNKSQPVRFVQEALISDICKNWSEEDQIYIFCTTRDEETGENGSKETNWFDNGHKKATAEIEKIGLEHRLNDLRKSINLKPNIKEVDIDTGFSEKGMWEIFNTVYTQLQPEDQLFFDVTHAFRSIPLFSIVLFNYSKFMIDTRLVSIMYGAFEKLGPFTKVRELPVEKRVAPVIDLTNIARLQEYNQLASSLKDFGKIGGMKDAINQDGKNIQLYNFGKSLSDLDEYISTIDFKNLKKGKYIADFRIIYKKLKKTNQFIPPILNLLNSIDKETKDFCDKDSFTNIETAINWTIKHNWLMQSFPLAEEYIVYRIADKLIDLKPAEMTLKKYRTFISAILGMIEKDFANKKWRGDLLKYQKITNAIVNLDFIKEIRKSYYYVTSARNSLAHANGNYTYSKLRDDFLPYIGECIRYMNNNIDSIVVPSFDACPKTYFINLSNHPSDRWDEEQRKAAEEYGEIVDIPFPQVGPEASHEDILAMADECVHAIEEKAQNTDITVHVMGEMTLTYAIVSRLKEMGIRCVASTTERNTVVDDSGVKTSVFAFTMFREY